MKSSIAYFIVGLFLVHSQISAQTQPAAPARPEKAAQKDSARLELPDVVIYGTEQAARISGSKLRPRIEGSRLFTRRIEYQAEVSSQPELSQKMTDLTDNKLARAMTLASFGYGQFNTPTAELMRWQQLDISSYGINVTFLQSDGPFVNSRQQQLKGQAHVGLHVVSSLRTEIRARFDNQKYGLYGADWHQLKRHTTNGNVALTAQALLAGGRQLYAQVEADRYELSDSGSDTSFAESSENAGHFSFHYHTPLTARMQANLAASVSMLSNSAMDSSWQWITFSGDLFIPLRSNLSLKPSVMYESISYYASRLAPGIEAVYTPSSRFGLSAKVNRKLSMYGLKHILWQNPFSADRVRPYNLDMKLNVEASAELKISRQITTGVLLQRRWLDNYHYWQRNTIGTFDLHTMDDVAITTVTFRMSQQLSDNNHIDVGFQYIIDDVNIVIVPGRKAAIPYLEDFRLPVECEIDLPYRVHLKASATWVGARYADLNATQKLDDYITGSVHLDLKLNSYLSFFGQVENVTNSNHEIWLGYPAFGFQGIVGITGKW